jgi:ribonuclease HII
MKKILWTIGVDEAGRGPLAGSVYVGVYAVPKGYSFKNIPYVKDSKQLTEKRRNEAYAALIHEKKCKHAVASSNVRIIDQIGIVPAVTRALYRAMYALRLNPDECEVLLDGGLHASEAYQNQKTIVRGDETEKVISAASILAKVSRDTKMRTIAAMYPKYGFELHKGYGTPFHIRRIKQHGLCPMHRKTFCKNII